LKAYNLAFDRATVDGEITKVRKQFLGPVLALYQFEELGGIVDELLRGLRNGNAKDRCINYRSPSLAPDEDIMGQKAEQEWDVCLVVQG
jgi:hypothetical protein